MTSDVQATIDELGRRVEQFRDRMNPTTADTTIEHMTAAFAAKFDADGLGGTVNIAPAEALSTYAEQVREQYDVGLRQQAAELEQEIARTEAALQETFAAVATLPHPLDAAARIPASATETEMRRLRVTLDLDRAERRLAGRSLSWVAETYAALDDARDEALVYTIEDQVRRGWADIGLTNTAEDAGAVLTLRQAVQDRQWERAKRQHPDLVAAGERLRALNSATVRDLMKHVKTGRGVARRPVPTVVRLGR